MKRFCTKHAKINHNTKCSSTLSGHLKFDQAHQFRKFSTSNISLREFEKLLVANRGEIATRILRTGHEMGIRTVSVYAKQDSSSMHRYKADESYLIGKDKELGPIEAYLCIQEIIKIAKENGVDAIHPGYGFLSERADFARACLENGITFIGPPPDVVENFGDKTKARKLAKEIGVPVVPGTETPITSIAEAKKFCSEVTGFPIILKAAMGGGGRGMRIVRNPDDLEEAFLSAEREALNAFGSPAIFIEKFVEKPRHIEVQILADHNGNVVHLFERDCSVQRRHQKVVEIAPAPHLDDSVRQRILADAKRLAKHVGYVNAGTFEFLVDSNGKDYYFIEVNPRLQVEHTITEEITGIDIVRSQILIAEGVNLPDFGLVQENITSRGSAIQCRVTTEDPINGFQPDTGVIEAFRTGEGMGIRLDIGSGFVGSKITPYYDSLLVKVIGKGLTHEEASNKLRRALAEFRIRGVKSNIPFLQKVLSHEKFLNGAVDTSFIDTTPELFQFPTSSNRAQKLLAFLGETAINGPTTPLATDYNKLLPTKKNPKIPTTPNSPPPKGWKQILDEQGPEGFAKAVREKTEKTKQLLITDTTMRDAHQSLLATRVRTKDLLAIAPYTSHAMSELFSLECWGGATFDCSLNFLRECPWDRLAKLREAIPNIPFQMLLRGANGVGYKAYCDNVIYKFCKTSKQYGMDVFRIFDSLNYLPNLEIGIDAVGNAGGVVEAAISYSGDISDPKKTKYTLEYYLELARKLVEKGVHILAIKDMAGLLKPQSSAMLISALRKEFPNIPIHVHTHDTAGTGVASMLACAENGADIVDAAIDSMSGLTSQPSLGAIVASLQNNARDTRLDLDQLSVISNYWEQARELYRPFECVTTLKSGSSDVYKHEIPGGQYTNLSFQSFSLGLGDRFPLIKEAYATANRLLGDIIKVTPSSKVVGDLAQFLVQNNLTEKDVLERADELSFPNSVIEYFSGDIGIPLGGFPEPLRTKVMRGKPSQEGRPGANLEPFDFDKLETKLKKEHDFEPTEVDLLSAALYPKVFEEYLNFKTQFGEVSNLGTRHYFTGIDLNEEIEIELEKGKVLHIKLKAIGEAGSDGKREVYFDVNGQPRLVLVQDKKLSKELKVRSKADKKNPHEYGSSMPGKVVDVRVKEGDVVKKGDTLIVLSAMKMETQIKCNEDGVVKNLQVKVNDELAAGDLICVVSK
ncbi:hypothetical protein ABK040_009871 [Willaertia magna]